MHAECPTEWPPVDPVRFGQHIAASIARPDMILFGVAETDGIVGMVTAVAGDYSWSSERRAACELLYILPEHRNLRTALCLLRHFETWADILDARHRFMGDVSGIATDKLRKFYERAGYRRIGSMYWRRAA